MDSEDRFGIIMMLIASVTFVALLFLLVSCGNDINAAIDAANGAIEDANARIDAANARMARDVSPGQATKRANGCPLDAIEYDPPVAMGDCQRCLRFTDRLTGESWWILRTLDGYVVLPIENEAQ